MRKVLLTLLLTLLIADFAEARIFGRRWRRGRVTYGRTYSNGDLYGGTGYQNAVSIDPATQAIAERKARLQASRNSMFHDGSSFGYVATYEGVGMAGSASAALNMCCNNGGVICGQAAVQGSGGSWFACRLYR